MSSLALRVDARPPFAPVFPSHDQISILADAIADAAKLPISELENRRELKSLGLALAFVVDSIA